MVARPGIEPGTQGFSIQKTSSSVVGENAKEYNHYLVVAMICADEVGPVNVTENHLE